MYQDTPKSIYFNITVNICFLSYPGFLTKAVVQLSNVLNTIKPIFLSIVADIFDQRSIPKNNMTGLRPRFSFCKCEINIFIFLFKLKGAK